MNDPYGQYQTDDELLTKIKYEFSCRGWRFRYSNLNICLGELKLHLSTFEDDFDSGIRIFQSYVNERKRAGLDVKGLYRLSGGLPGEEFDHNGMHVSDKN
ncbi:hypothetical protein [Acidithrix ferrooxidans]|uniref:Uncharacterized protein n=1 Tax=Acidithrix ferrooxidans TaxID=1280514 RepID=A0A0D8HJE5_9ACTN|nr:hypothetical protein [Acidithrix ferrooxidans]KJF18063.1 hypothetical protein AXFE_11620 [Acidithrix ferrooxidans]